jgi:hypothetical protein
VRLSLVDVQDREVAVLSDGMRKPGRNTAALDASEPARGDVLGAHAGEGRQPHAAHGWGEGSGTKSPNREGRPGKRSWPTFALAARGMQAGRAHTHLT